MQRRGGTGAGNGKRGSTKKMSTPTDGLPPGGDSGSPGRCTPYAVTTEGRRQECVGLYCLDHGVSFGLKAGLRTTILT